MEAATNSPRFPADLERYLGVKVLIVSKDVNLAGEKKPWVNLGTAADVIMPGDKVEMGDDGLVYRAKE